MPLIPDKPKIHILPNMFTAGNLLCGFFAILFIFEQIELNEKASEIHHFEWAIIFILIAGVLDLLDGRVARIKGQESPFGREFDSLADIVSFGVAPALLLMELVLRDFERFGVIVACLFLACGAMRLARFNVIASEEDEDKTGEFIGLPIPAAAIVISSLTLFLLKFNDDDKELGGWRYVLLGMMMLMSLLMISGVRYPSFKRLNIRTKRSIPWMICALVFLLVTSFWWQYTPAVLSTSYLLYGMVRPWVSKRWRHEIEDTPEDDEEIEIEVEVIESKSE